VGYGEEAPDQLVANPRNWRIHPTSQQEALLGVLRQVGVVQDVLVNRATGFVVDGHLRVMLALREGQASIPVKYVELTPDEEALVLATFDPLGALAGIDKDQLAALLREVETSDAAVQQLLSDLAAEVGLQAPDIEFPEYDEDAADEVEWLECPACGHRWPK
jgi:ParB-like chromosome segregation protein Spo0J